jgi:hypothetical protein
VQESDQNSFIIKNYGTSKTYNLEINERSSAEQEFFGNSAITLEQLFTDYFT